MTIHIFDNSWLCDISYFLTKKKIPWNFRFSRFKTLVISYVVLISLVYKFLLLWNYIFCSIPCFVTYHIMRLFILCDISTFVKCHTLWHLIILNIICCDSSFFFVIFVSVFLHSIYSDISSIVKFNLVYI